MKLRYMLLSFTFTLILLSAAAYAADNPQIYSFAIAPEGNQFSVIGKGGKFVLIHIPTSKSAEFPMPKGTEAEFDNVTAAALSPESQWLALGTANGSILLYNDVSDLWKNRNTPSEKLPSPLKLEDKVEVRALAFSPDGEMLAAGTANGSLHLVPMSTLVPELVNKLNKSSSGIPVVAFSPDDETLAAGREDGTITLWDTKTKRVIASFAEHTWEVTALAFSPDGKTLAAGTFGSELTLWDVPSEKKLTDLEGHDDNFGAINTLAFSPNGKLLVSGADDKKFLSWNTKTRHRIDGYDTGRAVLSIAFAANGKNFIVGNIDGKIESFESPNSYISPNQDEQVQTAQRPENKEQERTPSVTEQQNASKATPQIAQDNNEKQQEPRTTVKKPDKTAPKIRAFRYPATVRQSEKTTPLRVSVIDNESGIKSAKIGDKEMSPYSEDGYELTVSLEEGDNPFTLIVTDKENNSRKRQFTIHRIPTLPKIEVEVMDLQLDANNSAEIPQRPFEIKVSVTDESDIEYVKCDDEAMEYLSADSEKRVYRKYFKDPLRSKRTFKITAKDTKGASEAKQEITLTPIADQIPADKTPPTIVITEVEWTVAANEKSAYISGTITDADSGISSVKIDNIENPDVSADVLFDSEGNFKHLVPLKEGINEFIITATDKEQNPESETVEIHRPATPPEIEVINPKLVNNSVTIPTDSFPLTIEVIDESEVDVRINGRPVSPENDGKTFRTELNRFNVHDGKVSIIATDSAGGTSPKAFTVNFQASPQRIVTTTPADKTDNVSRSEPTSTPGTTSNRKKEEGKPRIQFLNDDLAVNRPFITGNDSFTLVIYVFDQSEIKGEVEIKHLGKNQTFYATKTAEREYKATLPIDEGENAFHITVMDEWYNVGNAPFKIVKRPTDTEGPTITFLEADHQSIGSDGVSIKISEQDVNIRGSVTDVSGIQTVTIKGKEVRFAEDGSFDTYIPVKGGSNRITVTATDTAGNPSTRTFTIYREIDTEGPTIRITRVGTKVIRPTDNIIDNPITVIEKEIIISGSVKDVSGVNVNSVKVNGESPNQPIDANGTFEKHISLDDGENVITVTATDTSTAKNRSTYRFTISREKDTAAPTITFKSVGDKRIDPTDNSILISEEEIVIRGSVTDASGVYNDSININGEYVKVAADGAFEKKLYLNYGENPITVTATDTHGNTEKDTPFTITHQFDRTNKDFALFFATQEYLNAKELPSAIRDAEAVAENLRDNYGFETEVFKNLTRLEILNTLYIYSNNFKGIEYTPDSQLLIFFAGHGHYDERAGAGYLITTDTDTPRADPTFASALSHSKLREQIEAMTCQHILVLLDTCFSGTFDPKFQPPPANPMLRNLFNEASLLQQIKLVLNHPALWCLTAAGDQYVVDGNTGHSPFAKAFLNALNTKGGNDLLLDLEEVWKAIEKSKDDPLYERVIEQEKARGNEFKRPEPRKAPFGETPLESNFYFFPKIE